MQFSHLLCRIRKHNFKIYDVPDFHMQIFFMYADKEKLKCGSFQATFLILSGNRNGQRETSISMRTPK